MKRTTLAQTMIRYDVEEYRDGRWVMYDWTGEVVASGRARWRPLRLVAIELAYLRRWRADRRALASAILNDQHEGSGTA